MKEIKFMSYQEETTTTGRLTTKELAIHLGVHRQTVLRMAEAGLIPGLRIGVEGRAWRFDLAKVEEALAHRSRRKH